MEGNNPLNCWKPFCSHSSNKLLHLKDSKRKGTLTCCPTVPYFRILSWPCLSFQLICVQIEYFFILIHRWSLWEAGLSHMSIQKSEMSIGYIGRESGAGPGKVHSNHEQVQEKHSGSLHPPLLVKSNSYLKCCAHQEPKETVVAKARESLLPHADPFKETKPFQVALSWSGDGRPLCRFPRRWVRCCYHRNYCYHLLSITPWQ